MVLWRPRGLTGNFWSIFGQGLHTRTIGCSTGRPGPPQQCLEWGNLQDYIWYSGASRAKTRAAQGLGGTWDKNLSLVVSGCLPCAFTIGPVSTIERSKSVSTVDHWPHVDEKGYRRIFGGVKNILFLPCDVSKIPANVNTLNPYSMYRHVYIHLETLFFNKVREHLCKILILKSKA